MLKWKIEKSQYETVHTSSFDEFELTIIEFCANGGYRTYMRKVPNVSSIFSKTYGNSYTIDEVKENFLNDLQEYLDRESSYWSEMSHGLWMAINFEE